MDILGINNYSGFWRRVGASIIDAIILGIIGGIFSVGQAKSGDPLSGGALQTLLAVIGAGISVFYTVLMECSVKQATIGKLILGIRVTDLSGNRISFLRSLARQACKFFSLIIFGLGFLFPLFTKKKQTLHDMICGCLVVKQKINF